MRRLLSLCAFLACLIGSAPAQEPVKEINEFGFVWADIEKETGMPLVDPYAADNSPEAIFRHAAGLWVNKDPSVKVEVFILVGLDREEILAERGRLLKPRSYHRFVVSVPHGYVLLGKYRLLRNAGNPQGIYFARISTHYDGQFGYTKRWLIHSN